MNVGKSVRKSIDEWSSGDFDSAMLHACNAVDGTARAVHPKLGNKLRFTRLLRDNYFILGPMSVPGIDLVATRFPISVKSPTTPDRQPDLADLVYGIHRCAHAHGDDLPGGFELLSDAAGPPRVTRVEIERGKVQLSDRVIFGLLAVAVLSPASKGQRVPDSYYLTFGAESKMIINEWWGRADDFHAIAMTDPTPSVKLDFRNWAP